MIKLQRESPKFKTEKTVFDRIAKLRAPLADMFVPLLAFRLLPDCDLYRRTSRIPNAPRRQEVRALNQPGPCLELLLENKGKSFQSFLDRRMPSSRELVFSFIGQIAALHITMYQMGFIHNDLHFENILLTRTKEESVTFDWQRMKVTVPYHNGRMLVAIDYAEATRVRKGSHRRLLDDILESIGDLVLKRYAYKHATSIVAQRYGSTVFVFPKRVIQGMDQVIREYPEVVARAKAAAIELSVAYEPIFRDLEARKIVRRAGEAASNPLVRHAVRRIQNELQLTYPGVFAQIFDAEKSFRRTLLEEDDIRAILECSTVPALLRVIQAHLK